MMTAAGRAAMVMIAGAAVPVVLAGASGASAATRTLAGPGTVAPAGTWGTAQEVPGTAVAPARLRRPGHPGHRQDADARPMQFFRRKRGIRALSRAVRRGPVPAGPGGPVVLMRLASQDGGPVTSGRSRWPWKATSARPPRSASPTRRAETAPSRAGTCHRVAV